MLRISLTPTSKRLKGAGCIPVAGTEYALVCNSIVECGACGVATER